jgi:hypothetical protein
MTVPPFVPSALGPVFLALPVFSTGKRWYSAITWLFCPKCGGVVWVC